jgi:hypothetical protein
VTTPNFPEIVTDHRMPKTAGFFGRFDKATLFRDRSFVRPGCDCDYCLWEGEDDEPKQEERHEV